MTFATAFLLALSLSMDAFAAAMGKGAALRRPGLVEALRIGAYFGCFELTMPLVGWVAGLSFAAYVTAFDHWLAFVLLLFAGGKMIFESLRDDDEDEDEAARHRGRPGMGTMVLTALGTSVDATAVGVTLAFMDVDIVSTAILIGCVTFGMASGGVLIGRAAGPLLGKRAELIGGLGLIAIGCGILYEHTMGG